MTIVEAPSPNFDARKAVPDTVVLHYTGMESGEAAIEPSGGATTEVDQAMT